jgi:SAM-dependent methyltransferase
MKNSTEKIIVRDEPWFKNWFDSSFYHKLYANRDENEAAGFIDELLEELQPEKRSYMLDLGCGNGRHSRYLASKGFNVTGIDLAASSIRYANNFKTPSLKFYRHDMRMAFGRNYFDYIFNFFTSFGYFKDDNENDKVINNMAASLKPGGILVMDYINVIPAERKLIAEETKEIDGVIYHIHRHADKNHFFKKIVIDDMLQGNPFEFTEQVAKFSFEDFETMFSNNGLQIQQVYGDYQLGNYDIEKSPRLILIAKKLS